MKGEDFIVQTMRGDFYGVPGIWAAGISEKSNNNCLISSTLTSNLLEKRLTLILNGKKYLQEEGFRLCAVKISY